MTTKAVRAARQAQMVGRIPAAVLTVAHRIHQAGGRCGLVGGAVIDLIQEWDAKDWDLEVFGLSIDDIERILADLAPSTVGRAFGIVKVRVDDLEIDLNVPRRDSKVGTGHKGFSAEFDPTMTPTEAARRRDFTINAMSLDLSTGQLIDPFGGLDDLEAGVLRATDPERFVDDPLRALRAMQLVARKARVVDPATVTLIRSMASTFPELPKERVNEEFRKLLLKAPKPSVGLTFLRDCGWMVHFPELEALVDCPQNPDWHPEGDVWTHSLLAADAAAEVLPFVPEHQREGFAFGVFLHDVGKPATTITEQMIRDRHPHVLMVAESAKKKPEDMLLTAHGHDTEGVAPAESFMRRLTDQTKVVELVKGIVELHMQPWNLTSGGAKKGAFARLHRRAVAAGGDLRLIGRVCQCDSCATGKGDGKRSLVSGTPNWEHRTSARIMDFADQIETRPEMVTPKVQGRDLIAAGLIPGREFSEILRKALDIQDADAALTRDEILARVLADRTQGV